MSRVSERRQPLYRRIADDLVARIRDGRYAPGARLPTEHELCRQHGVSRITVRKALEILVAGHYVLRRRGIGTTVRPHDPDCWAVTLTAPLHEVLPPLRMVLLRQATVTPPADLLRLAGWKRGARLRVFEATNHVASGAPLAHIGFYFPLDLARHMTGAMIEGPLPPSRLVGQRFGERVDSALQVVEATTASSKTARHLRIPPGTPLLRALRVYLAQDGRSIYAMDCLYHPRHYRFTARLAAGRRGRDGG